MSVQLLAKEQAADLSARPVLTPAHFLLQDQPGCGDSGACYRLYRAAVAHAAAHLRYSQAHRPAAALKPMGVAVVSAIEDARVEHLLMREYPGVRAWFTKFIRDYVETPDRYAMSFSGMISRMNLALIDGSYEDGDAWVNKARALFGAAAHDLENYDEFRRIASVLANDLGQLRVRFNPQQYVVSPPYRDDNSYLWDFESPNIPPPEAMDLHVPMEREGSDGMGGDAFSNEGGGEQDDEDLELARTTHAEWDYRIGIHRQNWCTVIDKLRRQPAVRTIAGGAQALMAGLPSIPLNRVRRLSRERRLRRQWEGDELDLNAAVEVMIDRRKGETPDPRLFIGHPRSEKSSSVLMLMDTSQSTNDVIAQGQESILEMEKRAALFFARTLLEVGDRVAIHGFCSNTRAEVNYYKLLDFGVPLDGEAIARVGFVAGRYSTRIGAAVRHATACLAEETADSRAILVVTDGAPSDVDIFDEKYLVFDARAAVQQARKSGINVYAVVVDPQAESYVETIFGYGNYRILRTAMSLLTDVVEIYARLSWR
ncbi:nitric oxide reductase activation protein NorD [Thiomonas sp.]